MADSLEAAVRNLRGGLCGDSHCAVHDLLASVSGLGDHEAVLIFSRAGQSGDLGRVRSFAYSCGGLGTGPFRIASGHPVLEVNLALVVFVFIHVCIGSEPGAPDLIFSGRCEAGGNRHEDDVVIYFVEGVVNKDVHIEKTVLLHVLEGESVALSSLDGRNAAALGECLAACECSAECPVKGRLEAGCDEISVGSALCLGVGKAGALGGGEAYGAGIARLEIGVHGLVEGYVGYDAVHGCDHGYALGAAGGDCGRLAALVAFLLPGSVGRGLLGRLSCKHVNPVSSGRKIYLLRHLGVSVVAHHSREVILVDAYVRIGEKLVGCHRRLRLARADRK